jgi:hypothetical protein
MLGKTSNRETLEGSRRVSAVQHYSLARFRGRKPWRLPKMANAAISD